MTNPLQSEREARIGIMQIAADLAQRKPLRSLFHLEDCTHIGHRQFRAAFEPADEACRLMSIRLRDCLDALASRTPSPATEGPPLPEITGVHVSPQPPAASAVQGANDIVARLRKTDVRHTQVSEDWEEYEAVSRVIQAEPIKVEAADEIERLRAALAATAAPSQEPSGLTEALAIAQWALRHPFDEWKGDAERKALDAIAAALASQKGQQK